MTLRVLEILAKPEAHEQTFIHHRFQAARCLFACWICLLSVMMGSSQQFIEPLASSDKMSSLNTLIYAKKSASRHLIARDFDRCVEVCKSSISDLLQNSPAISEMERYDVYYCHVSMNRPPHTPCCFNGNRYR